MRSARARTVALLLACGQAAAGVATAQPAPSYARIPTVTRLVKLFAEREAAVQAAAHARDVATLDGILDGSFEMRVASEPGRPIPRSDWLESVRTNGAPRYRLEQMAVYDLRDFALASFVLRPVDGGAALFVVDTWARAGDSWRLTIRYAAPAEQPAGTVPGYGAPAPAIPKKY